eukprot:TRINITY_DN28248_c0_g1_i1.p1 TRINITY_DN28248_c0_g1~~TRINITY_DN28248_c0_g1_i1.p1  ORF type:complete len:948 (+),score=185.87 TRINITY_DN28248_c0_g1_i1:89-2932(+)
MAGSRTAQPGLCRFAFSADVAALVRCSADRVLPQGLAQELIGDEPLDIEASLILDGEVFSTSRSSKVVFEPSPERGEFRPHQFVFAVKVRDVPQNSRLAFRLKLASAGLGSPSSSSTYRGIISLFNDRGVLRQGRRLVALLPEGSAESSQGSACASTLDSNEAAERWLEDAAASLSGNGGSSGSRARLPLSEALRLEEATELLRRGWMPVAPGALEGSEEAFAQAARETIEATGLPWLSIQLPIFQQPIVFAEPQYGQNIEVPPGVLSASSEWDFDCRDLLALKGPEWLLRPLRPSLPASGMGLSALHPAGRSFKCFTDYGAQLDHPALLKSLRLARSSRASMFKDRDARPSADQLRQLAELVRRPRRQFSTEEKHLLFRFRWSLTDQPGALTKFLHAVDWSDLEERQHAIELLDHWSPVDIDDALELLSKDFRGVPEVRQHAVRRLESATDADLQLYLLQLVQALRYEEPLHAALSGQDEEGASPAAASPTAEAGRGGEALAAFLIRRAVSCPALATLLHWYVVAETEGDSGGRFEKARQLLLDALNESSLGRTTRQLLERQVLLRKKLLFSVQYANVNKRDRIEKKVERFREALAAPEQETPERDRLELVKGLKDAIPLPVDPSVSLLRVMPEKCFLLKSAMVPGVLTCQVRPTAEPKGDPIIKRVMVKEGDDLRQDQLVLQLIILMDSILKKYGLDLQLTPYQVIALSRNDGMVEFVPDASNLSSILKDHNNDIQQFFRAHHPAPVEKTAGGYPEKHDADAPPPGGWGPQNSYGIKPEVLDNFVRSSAGYCVITYILGIGDRHLDNLMVTRDGRLFHIDFGFILGKDPKPFPPPMRICKEMVEGMGGNASPGYQSFKSKCCQAFKILRRHAKLIINLLYLMTDSGIKDICSDPQFAILKVEQKFQALMDDEQAEEHFLNLIDESVNSLMPLVMEHLHKISIAMN